MWSIDPIQIQALAYIQTNICRTCFQKWNNQRRRERRKEGLKHIASVQEQDTMKYTDNRGATQGRRKGEGE
jgi:hypothetical protein